MRLIDADKLKQEFEVNGLGYQYYMLNNAPTVDAIPIEWIKEWLITFNGLSDVKGSFVIRMLLDSWEEKNRNELGKM